MSGTVIVLGAGASNGLGGALARRFAAGGRHVIVAGRTEAKVEALAAEIQAAGGSAEGMRVDVASEADQDALFAHAARIGPVDAVLYNAGNNAIIPFEELTPEQVETLWRVGCFGAFLTAKRAAPLLSSQGRGACSSPARRPRCAASRISRISRRRKRGCACWLRRSAAEYGPKGVHVAHVIIDGVVDGEMVRNRFAQYLDALGEDGGLSPDAVAETFWQIHQQHRSAWTHELDLRPYKENW